MAPSLSAAQHGTDMSSYIYRAISFLTNANRSVKSRHACQIGERLGNRAINQKVTGSISGSANYDVSMGKAPYPTCLGGNVPVPTVSPSG